MVSLKVEVGKKDVTWIVFLVAVSIVGFVYGYSSSGGTPSIMGHSMNEIDFPSCSDGQFLMRNSSGWGCGDSGSVAVGGITVIDSTGQTVSLQDALDNLAASGGFSIPCTWNGWAGVGAQNGARHVNACGVSYMGFIDLYCSGGKVINTRLYKSTSCE